jgi:hypothetical protein
MRSRIAGLALLVITLLALGFAAAGYSAPFEELRLKQ